LKGVFHDNYVFMIDYLLITGRMIHEARISLAIEGRTADGWYSQGKMEIK